MFVENRVADYQNRIEELSLLMSKHKTQRKYLPLLRFVAFLITIFLIYNYVAYSQIWLLILSVVLFIGFIVLTRFDFLLKAKIVDLENLIQINNNELAAIDGDTSAFDSGAEYVDYDHTYTCDLDVFGISSLYQYVNRSSTAFGKNRLASYLKDAYGRKNEILSTQTAVKELSKLVDFRQKIQLIFHNQKVTETDKVELENWLDNKSQPMFSVFMKVFLFAMPTITMICFMLAAIGLVVIQIPSALFMIQLFVVYIYSNRFFKIQNQTSSKLTIIKKYASCLSHIESTDFESERLVKLKATLKDKDGISSSVVIVKLCKLMSWMDSNLNLLVSILLNGMFMFSLHLLVSLDKWKLKYGRLVLEWFDVIAEFEALSSIANYAHNNPEYVYPKPVYDNFVFVANDLGHPLLSKDTCVTNSIDITDWNQFGIITGANMSGKSTFLRTVGVNYIMAMLGAPVFASKMTFSPIQIHSSIRNSDSLAKKESYFYAELKRLKQIIDDLQKGERKLILLDEILKGTNSQDKQSGSIALIKQLLNYNSIGLFATHDLVLGELKNQYPSNVQNYCFEISIVGEQMHIDYKLRSGVCKNLNATYLMRKMGVLVDEEYFVL